MFVLRSTVEEHPVLKVFSEKYNVKADICEVYKFSITFYGMLFMS